MNQSPAGVRFKPVDRDQSDYVYRASDLIDLPGRKYQRKRNRVNKFKKSVEFEYRDLTENLVPRVTVLQEHWCHVRACHLDPGLFEEDNAVFEALTHFGRLDYSGGVIIIEDRVVAFSLGEPLNPDTAVIHIEKANPEVPGLYNAINQFFCRARWSEMKFINREQDLGVDGLREAKLGYQPDHLEYVVTRRY